MNILEDGKWLKLSKVNYQNVWYQIYANSLGIRVFIKDNLEYPSLNSFLYLDMLFNYKNNGIYYSDNKTKQLLSNYFKFTLNINVYYKAYKVCNHFKLIKNKMNGVTKKIEGLNKPKTLITLEEIKDYLPDTFDIEEIIDNNPNIGEEYKEIITKTIYKF